jgi:hypothetical protein
LEDEITRRLDIFFASLDDISLEGRAVHSLADAKTLLLVFTTRAAGRPTGAGSARRRSEEDGSWDWVRGHSAATTAAGLARSLVLRGCRSISISASACGFRHGSVRESYWVKLKRVERLHSFADDAEKGKIVTSSLPSF